MSVGLAELWRSWGLKPDAVIGQSQGEIAAAYCAGALSLEQSGRLSCLRADLIDRLAPPGAMAWLPRAHHDIPALLAELGVSADTAVVEGPDSVVLSGTVEQIERLLAGCEDRGIDGRRIPVGYAAHSSRLEPVHEPLLEGLADLVPTATAVPFLSTVTGTTLPGTDLDRGYWWRNLREPVLLDPAVRTQLGRGDVVFLQMSPHPLLTVPIRRIAEDGGATARTTVLESLHSDRPELATLYGALTALYAAGCDIDCESVQGRSGPFWNIPRYPWQRSRYWQQAGNCPWPPIGTEPSAAGTVPDRGLDRLSDTSHPLLGERVRGGPDTYEWSGALEGDRVRRLLDHQVAGLALMPGAAFLELALAAAGQILPARPSHVSDLRLLDMLVLDDHTPTVRITATRGGPGDWKVSIAARADADAAWTEHAGHWLATARATRRR